jgi:superfamily II DNA or RNA helicase
MELRKYQQEGHDAIFAAWDRGVKRQLGVLATGGGKTVLFSHVIKTRGGRALVLAHRDELLQQAADKILKVIPGAHIGIVRAGLDQRHAQIVIASVQTLARKKRLERLERDFATIVIDEAHHTSASSYQKIIDYFAESDPLILGVTATPDRGDGKTLDGIFEEIVFNVGIEQGIEEGWLCDIEGKLITIKDLDLSKVHTKKGDLDTTELEAIMEASNWHEHCANAFFEHAQDRPTVVFVPKVQMAHDLAAHLAAQGARAAAIDGNQATGERQKVLSRLRSGDVQVIVNCMVLTEGFDEPSLSCAMMCRPTKSRALYQQCIGRVLRPHPGKTSALVLDLVGVSQRLDLINVATLAGVKRMVEGETFRQATLRAQVEEARAKEAEEERRRLETELAARRVDLLRGGLPDEDRNSRNGKALFHWTLGLNKQRSLQLKDRVVVVRPMADESWIARDGQGWQHIADTAEACQAAAEDYARDLHQKTNGKLADRSAPWRRQPASDAQLFKLRQWQIPHDPFNCSKGEASDLMDAFLERKKLRRAAYRRG